MVWSDSTVLRNSGGGSEIVVSNKKIFRVITVFIKYIKSLIGRNLRIYFVFARTWQYKGIQREAIPITLYKER